MTNQFKKTKCIMCNKEFDINSDTIPFCSKRCSYIDLNNWLDEKYSIKSEEDNFEKDI